MTSYKLKTVLTKRLDVFLLGILSLLLTSFNRKNDVFNIHDCVKLKWGTDLWVVTYVYPARKPSGPGRRKDVLYKVQRVRDERVLDSIPGSSLQHESGCDGDVVRVIQQ
jgi:hypothetical protein